MFDLDNFISQYVIKRNKSLFLQDINENEEKLEEKVKDKSILVIGGAGSIGASFIKVILKYKPKSLTVVDINENGLTELTRDLRATKGMYVPEEYITYPMDFSSFIFEKMFRSHKGYDIVANFSAHKHVRSEKDVYSVEALLRNNVINIKKLLDLLAEFPPEEYFCVSTDKAANPVNIMGASKRIMEDVIFSYSDKFSVKTARFANVAFSNGSLPAGFLKRIQKLQPISAPSNIARYFVSEEEAGQICMLACMLGKNREIFFPKLEKSQMMSFDKIASKLLEIWGYEILPCSTDAEAVEKSEELKRGGMQYPVHYSVADTSGEKEYEEFFTMEEKIDTSRFRSLGIITEKEIPDYNRIRIFFTNLDELFIEQKICKEDIVKIMESYLLNFEHIETKKSLDSKM